jgi:hypothetical protein
MARHLAQKPMSPFAVKRCRVSSHTWTADENMKTPDSK